MNTFVKLALRNILRNRRRSALAFTALVLGVAVMVLLRGFVTAIETIEMAGTVYGQTGALQVHRTGYFKNIEGNPLQLDFADSDELRQKVLAVKGVTALSPRIQFSGMYSPAESQDKVDGPVKTKFFSARAFDPQLEKPVCPRLFEWVVEGRMFSSNTAAELVLTTELGEGTELAEDDAAPRPIETWPAVIALDRDGSTNGEPVLTVGKLGSALPGDRRFAFTNLGTAQKLLRMEGRVTEYAVAIDKLANAPRIKDELQAALGPEFEVQRWDEVVPYIESLAATENFMFNLITSIFLIVVLLGVLNSMLMNVLERTREIGTMMSLGFKRAQIVKLFVIEGTLLGFFGGLVGVTLGVAGVFVFQKSGVHLNAPGSEIDFVLYPDVTLLFLVRALVSATVGSAIATLWPARRASGLRPVEALASA